jgi:cerevisin
MIMMPAVGRVLQVRILSGLLTIAYVVDTGVNVKHEEFGGRAIWGATIPTGDEDEDGNGHGTHVAGTIASKTYGVAKKAKIVAVKVLRSNGSGTMSDVLKGVEWAAEATEAEEAAEKKKGKKSTYKVRSRDSARLISGIHC